MIGDGAVVVRWSVGAAGSELMLAANLAERRSGGFPVPTGRVLWREGEQDRPQGHFGPWAVRWSLSGESRDRRDATPEDLAASAEHQKEPGPGDGGAPEFRRTGQTSRG